MMRTIPLDLPFRGRRNYIHGTDLYEAIASALQSETPSLNPIAISFSIHHFSRHAVDLTLSDKPVTAAPTGISASFHSNAGLNGWITETDREVDRRVPFNEEEIVEASALDGDTARIIAATNYPPIDVLVILNKHWHDVNMGESGKRWVFVKLELERLLQPEDADSISTRIDQNLAKRMTRAIVAVGNRPIGHIFFSKIDA